MNDDEISTFLQRAVPDPPRALPARLPVRRRGRWPVVASALAVVAVVAGIAFVVHRKASVDLPAQTSVSCPATVETQDSGLWVPASPTVDGASASLVPQETPIEARVCKYDPQHRLLQQRTMSNPAEMADDLQLPKLVGQMACDLVLRPAAPYVLELQYPTGRVWVSLDDTSCRPVTNGVFNAQGGLGADAAQSVATGTWTPSPQRGACYTNIGRAGQEDAMVPAGVQAVDVCGKDGTVTRTISDDAVVKHLVNVLDAPPTRPTSAFCQGGPGNVVTMLFRYAHGRSVLASVLDGCQADGNTTNNSLVAELSPGQIAEVQHVTGVR